MHRKLESWYPRSLDTGYLRLVLHSQVAFLAAMVGPKVAAAAAQRALEVLSEEDPSVGDNTQSPAIGDTYHHMPSSNDPSKGTYPQFMNTSQDLDVLVSFIKCNHIISPT